MGDGSLLTSSWDDIQKFFGLNGETTANVDGMNLNQARNAKNAAAMSNAGLMVSMFGAATSAVGAYYAAKTQQYQMKSQASSLQFQSSMDTINARQAEMSAQTILEQGKTQVQQYTMRAGQEQASQTTATAARGVDLSSGSAIAQRASNELVKDMDVYTIDANATRAAWAQRTTATNYSNEALLARTGAVNLLASAKTVSPFAAATTSLLGGASQIASQWDWRRKLQMSTLDGSN